jgi:catechol 2,3-dioxygenase-like lactoylglutathione lyase family enzyme
MIEIRQINHCSLMVQDVARARRFYCDILGMEHVPHPAHYDFGIAWCRRGDAEIHLVLAADSVQHPGDPPLHPNPPRDVTFARHICLRVADLDAAVETLRRHDWPILAGPRPRGDGGRQLYLRDPDGHLIELAELPWLD